MSDMYLPARASRRVAAVLAAGFGAALFVLAPTAISGTALTGPAITFFGPVNMQTSIPLTCPGRTPDNVPICNLDGPTNFFFVVEGRPGPSTAPVGTSTFNAQGLPDLQIQTDRTLGNGSPAICDAGGVAAISPPDLTFSNPGPVNDFACRFSTEVCTRPRPGDPSFLVPSSTVQFCVTIGPAIAFANGDTRLTVRLRDEAGGLTEPRQLVLHVGAPVPTATATVARPTPTVTPGGQVTLDAVIRAIFNTPQASASDVNDDGRVTAADITALLSQS